VRQRHDKHPLSGSAGRFRHGAAAWLARAGLVARAGYDTTARRVRTFGSRPVTAEAEPPEGDAELRASPFLYLSVGLVAGAVIALQIGIMRLFSVGSWAHFGSLVVSLAMLGFGLTSAIMCAGKDWFERHWRGVAAVSLLVFGPLMVAANLIAQQIPFNAIFLISDPVQKWKLFGNFVLYLTPFLWTRATLPLLGWCFSGLTAYVVWDLSRHGGRWIVPAGAQAFELAVPIAVAIALSIERRRRVLRRDSAASLHS